MNNSLAILCACAVTAFGDHDGIPKRTEPVQARVELFTDRVQIGPGEDFDVAARVELPLGWRTFWDNPGDFGERLSAKLVAPRGFTVNGPFYPVPQVFEGAEGRRCFGYESGTTLVFHLTAPKDLGHGVRVDFRAEVAWTAYESAGGPELVAGTAQATASVATYPLRDRELAAHVDALQRARAALPKPWKQLAKCFDDWEIAYVDMGEGEGLTLVLRVAGATELEFLPLECPGFSLIGSSLAIEKTAAVLTLSYTRMPGVAREKCQARGVLRVVREDGAECFALQSRCDVRDGEE